MAETEETWIQQALEGDRAAFSSLVETYQVPVYNLAYRMLGNAAEAEDAAQEAFIRAYTRLHTYDPARKFSSWLLAIASHYCIDVLRKRRIQTLPLDDLPPRTELAIPATAQPEQVIVRQQAASAVRRLLSMLSPSYRTPLILRYWYDMSYREIADAMGVTENAVKTRLYRARGKLAHYASASGLHTGPRPAVDQSQALVESAA